MFLASQFGTHGKDRPGFEKLLSGLSDAHWGKGSDMIKELTKRGAQHSFDKANDNIVPLAEFDELQALAKAVEIEKALLIRANRVHRHHSHATLNDAKSNGYDAGMAHYIEEEIIEGQTETLRNLVGHVNDLKRMWKGTNTLYPLSLFMFDGHLKN